MGRRLTLRREKTVIDGDYEGTNVEKMDHTYVRRGETTSILAGIEGLLYRKKAWTCVVALPRAGRSRRHASCLRPHT